MADDLDEFIADDRREAESSAETTIFRQLVLFRYGSEVYAVSTSAVDSIVPWRTPVPLPRVSTIVQGVIQERGRIVTVLSHPAGMGSSDGGNAVRTIICATDMGFLGLPATETLRLGAVQLHAEPKPGQVVDSEVGLFTLLDPQQNYHRVLETLS